MSNVTSALSDRLESIDDAAGQLALELEQVMLALEQRTACAVRATEANTNIAQDAHTGLFEAMTELENEQQQLFEQAAVLKTHLSTLTKLASIASTVRKELFTLEIETAKLCRKRLEKTGN